MVTASDCKAPLSTLFVAACLFALEVSSPACVAQSSSTGAKPGAAAPSGSSGFSIETEMLTYRALESNSEAIACDIAAAIGGAKADTSHPANGMPCTAAAGPATATVVVLPFEKTALVEFEAWRGAISTMAELQSKAAALGCPKSRAGTASSSSPTAALGSFLSLSPAGPPLALAQSVLGLLASEEATTSVGGNIQDLAFINNVVRELKVLQINVLTPSTLAPENLTLLDATTSPFMAYKQKMLLARGCLASLPSDGPDAASVKQTIASIDSYMDSLSAEKPTKAATEANAGVGATGGAGGAGSQSTNSTYTAISSASPLTAILHGDGLAQALGLRYSVSAGKVTPPPPGSYVLMLKALESGGSVTGKSNILGTRLRYSGGAVGTYALFALDGKIACSGNVYDYAGPIPAKHFERDLRKFRLDPGQQVILHTGSCPVADSAAPVVPASNVTH